MKKCIYILIILLLPVCTKIHGQQKWTFSTGIGIPETINISLRHSVNNFQFGMNIGTLPGVLVAYPDFNYYNSGLLSYYHFENSKGKKRYIRGGIIFSLWQEKIRGRDYWEYIFRYGMLDIRLGRKFIFERGGLEVDFGLYTNYPFAGFDLYVFETGVLPSFGVSYLFGKQ